MTSVVEGLVVGVGVEAVVVEEGMMTEEDAAGGEVHHEGGHLSVLALGIAIGHLVVVHLVVLVHVLLRLLPPIRGLRLGDVSVRLLIRLPCVTGTAVARRPVVAVLGRCHQDGLPPHLVGMTDAEALQDTAVAYRHQGEESGARAPVLAVLQGVKGLCPIAPLEVVAGAVPTGATAIAKG